MKPDWSYFWLVAAWTLTAPTALPNTSPSAFEAEIRAFEAADTATTPPRDAVLFVGSSSFTRWTSLTSDFPGFTVLNRGFGGSQFRDVLHFFERVVAVYHPALVVVYEGDNDLAEGRSVEDVFADWTAFADRAERELPQAGVLFVSVKPSPSRRAQLEAQQALNTRIAADCRSRPGCAFVDVSGPMLDANGEPRAELFVTDRLHMNSLGYAGWVQAIGEELEAWASAHPERSIRAPLGRLFVDFGSASLTGAGSGPTPGARRWNNLTAAIGASNTGRLSNLVSADGQITRCSWLMTSRFNGVNQNGTTTPAPFPTSATRDSMFGNTESFSGLANVHPSFQITGLTPGIPHTLTFYASRTGVSDNRETRYTVTGSTMGLADLDVANNVTRTAQVSGIEPDAEGTLHVALSPGPRNNNVNHFVYLGAMVLEESAPAGRVFFFDIGGDDSRTADAPSQTATTWNDLTLPVGSTAGGSLPDLLDSQGVATGIGLQMVTGFRAEDVSGDPMSGSLPPSASRDSLVGHGAPWNGLEPLLPEFRLSGLRSNLAYTLGFHASCSTANPSRQTRYQVVAEARQPRETLLEPKGNTNRVAWLTDVPPSEQGLLEVQVLPGPANTSEARLTHLGALALEWRKTERPPSPTLHSIAVTNGQLRLHVRTAWGRSCRVERSSDLRSWTEDSIVRPGADGLAVNRPIPAETTFFRLADATHPADAETEAP